MSDSEKKLSPHDAIMASLVQTLQELRAREQGNARDNRGRDGAMDNMLVIGTLAGILGRMEIPEERRSEVVATLREYVDLSESLERVVGRIAMGL